MKPAPPVTRIWVCEDTLLKTLVLDRRPAAQGAARSVQLERRTVILFEAWVLLGLFHHAIADHQKVEFVAHEAAERILRRADNRLAADVEAGVDQHRTARAPLKAR